MSADPSVIEAMSWRLASELVRRHPELRILRTHPGGGQYDCLTIIRRSGGVGRVDLNRVGSLQVLERFDGGEELRWNPSWVDYLEADPRRFLGDLEEAAGLNAPASVPGATPTTLTYRALATLAATAIKSTRPIDIQSGFIDTSGYGSGPNRALDEFTAIPAQLRRPLTDDLNGQPGYRFWIVHESDVPVLALEELHGRAWAMSRSNEINLVETFRRERRNVAAVALALLRSRAQQS